MDGRSEGGQRRPPFIPACGALSSYFSPNFFLPESRWMASSSRLIFVPSRLAESTHAIYIRRYDGARLSKSRRAAGFLRSACSMYGDNFKSNGLFGTVDSICWCALQSSRHQTPAGFELCIPFAVHGRPFAIRLAWRELAGITCIIETLDQAVAHPKQSASLTASS